MAIENIAVNFHGGTAASVSGKTINNYQGISAGEFDADLSGYDTGAATGVSGSSVRALTASTSGRATSSPLTDLSTAINTQGSYSQDSVNNPANNTVTYTFPSSVTAVDVDVYLCTTISQQDNLDITVNGSTQSAHSSSGNTTGTFLSFSGVVPDGSDQIVILVENNSGGNNDFIIHNGHYLSNIVESSGVTGTVSETLDDVTSSASGSVGGVNVTGTVSETLDAVTSSASGTAGVGFVNDTFDGTGSLGAHWSTYDDSGGGVTNVGRDTGYFEGRLDSNAGNITRWYNAEQGRLDYQTIEVPSSGVDTYVLKGVGVGPVGDRLADLTYTTNQFAFCGLMVHDDTLATATSQFAVIGHRGSSQQSTIEIKGTTAGTSDVTDEGADVFGAGVTHGDLAVDIDNTGIPKFKYRDIGDTAWTYIANGDGPGLVPSSFSMGSAGTAFKIGIIGYASDTIGVPWLFTADSMELIASPTGTVNETLDDVASTASGSVGITPVTGTVSETLDDVTSTASGLVITPVTGTINEVIDDVVSSGSGSVPTDTYQGNEDMISFFRSSTGLDSYNFNELAIAYYQQAGSTAAAAFNDSLIAAQEAVGFVGLAPTDWRNL